jgi:hypothetical protein
MKLETLIKYALTLLYTHRLLIILLSTKKSHFVDRKQTFVDIEILSTKKSHFVDRKQTFVDNEKVSTKKSHYVDKKTIYATLSIFVFTLTLFLAHAWFIPIPITLKKHRFVFKI